MMTRNAVSNYLPYSLALPVFYFDHLSPATARKSRNLLSTQPHEYSGTRVWKVVVGTGVIRCTSMLMSIL